MRGSACPTLARSLPIVSPKFRFFEKKRGGRRTGSKFWGTVFEALFYLGLLLSGCLLLVLILVTRIYPHWGANRYFLQTFGAILNRRIIEQGSGEARTYRPDVQVEYQVDGAEYRTWTFGATRMVFPERKIAEDALERFQVHGVYPVFYDPSEPSRAVLVRDRSGISWLLLLPPGALVIVGSVGLAFRVTMLGKSMERRAAMNAQRKTVELFDEEAQVMPEWPTIPTDRDVTNSPGIKLAYRLPIETSPGWKLAGTAIACAVWNLATALLSSVALRDHLDGEPNWWLTGLIAPFVITGAWLVLYVIRLWVNTTGVGPPRVEISAHPFAPGETYSVYLWLPQTGQLRFDRFTMSLVCEERAIYRLGTDTQTMVQRVYQRLILGGDELSVRRHEAYEATASFVVPTTAMHSFRAEHNSVEWKFVLRGNIKGWPDYERAYAVVVYPRRNGERKP